MGKIKQGILGPVAGKIGNVVGGSWKGVDYLRSIPASVTNPRTILQLSQRSRFLVMMRFLRPMLPFLKLGFKSMATRMSTFNAAMSYNVRHAVSGVFPDMDVQYEQVMVSRGNLPGVLITGLDSPAAGEILVSWDGDSDYSNADPTDRVMVLVYNQNRHDVRYSFDAGSRETGNATFYLPLGWTGDRVHVWLVVTNLPDLVSPGNASSISNSVYAGTVKLSL
jgi:hypothetical protein